MEKVLLLRADDEQFIDLIASKVAEKLIPQIQQPPSLIKQEKVYLTRIDTARFLKVSPPTVDRYVDDHQLTKLGHGKGARFRMEDVENLYERQNDYKYHHSRKGNISRQ